MAHAVFLVSVMSRSPEFSGVGCVLCYAVIFRLYGGLPCAGVVFRIHLYFSVIQIMTMVVLMYCSILLKRMCLHVV
jgi:hypothetical protein